MIKKQGKRFIVVVLALSLCTTMVGPYMVGNAHADHDCSTVNKATWFAFSGPSVVGELSGGSGVGCDMYHEDTNAEEIRDAEANQTAVDMYSAASSTNAYQENFDTVYDNYLSDTEAIAWQKAEAAIAQEYENGSSKAEAKVAAQEAIGEYYTSKQLNLIEQWNTSVVSMKYIHERAKQEGEVNEKDFGMVIEKGYDEDNPLSEGNGHVTHYVYSNTSIALANGSSSGIMQMRYRYTADGSTYNDGVGSFKGGHIGNNGWAFKMGAFGVYPPNDNYDPLMAGNLTAYWNRYQKIDTKQSDLNNETDAFVDATWQDYQDGNIDSTDVISRTTLMFEYGSKTTDGSGNMYDVVGALANMGLDSPMLNQTGMMQVTVPESGNTYNGLVFARNAPNGTWTVGETYNTSNISGPVMLATDEGEMKELERTFTIDSATDTDGNEVDEVETTSYNYQTSDTSSLNDKYNDLLSLTQEIEDRQDALYEQESSTGGSGGSTSAFDALLSEYFGIPLGAWIAGALLVAGIMARSGN